MLRKFTLVLIVALTSFWAMAQLPNGSTAPNFNVMDLDGNSHDLYADYLDKGLGMVLDLSAAWCAPCWVYHQTHEMENFYQAHGPAGDNTASVMFIESEPTNTVDQIYGVDTGDGTRAGTTLGDWTEGVTYPFADDATVAQAYNLTFYPTVYAIRPDRSTIMVYDVFYPTQEYLEYYLLNPNADDVGIFDNIGGEVFCGGTTVTPTFNAMNFGSDNLTSFKAEAMVEGQVVSTYDWSGEIGVFNTTRVAMPSFALDKPSYVQYRVSEPNGNMPTNPSFLSTVDSVFYFNLPTKSKITINVRTDFWPEETRWRLLDPNGSIILNSTELGVLSCDTEYQQEKTVTVAGCYTLVIEDDFGDGLLNGPVNPTSHSCGTPNGQANQAMGLFEVRNDDGQILFNNISYGDGISFDVEASGTSAIAEVESISEMLVFPNPTSDRLNINFDLTEATDMAVTVINITGQQVYSINNETYPAGTNQLAINARTLAEGTYFLSFRSANGVTTKRFNVSR